MSASSTWLDLGCRRTEQLIKEWPDLNHSVIERAVRDVAPVSNRLCSCWRQTFRACEADVRSMILSRDFVYILLPKLEPSSTAEIIANKISRFYHSCVIQK